LIAAFDQSKAVARGELLDPTDVRAEGARCQPDAHDGQMAGLMKPRTSPADGLAA
jgi:hypothetical protein